MDAVPAMQGFLSIICSVTCYHYGRYSIGFVHVGPLLYYLKCVRGLPLITYASRGGGGVNTNAYKCVQGGRGGLNMAKNTHFVRRYN